jgi:hypothetical protein
MGTRTWIRHVKNTSTILFPLNLSVYISYKVYCLYFMGTFFLIYSLAEWVVKILNHFT